MRLEVGPAEIHVVPGTPAAVVAQVFNTDDVINAYEVRVFGVDPAWVDLERERLSLFPSSAGVVTVLVNVPEDYPAGSLQLGVEVTPLVDPLARQLGNVTVVVAPRRIATMRADPLTVLAGARGSYNLTFTNEGNTPFALELTSLDPEAKVTSTFSPQTVELVPGEQVIVPVRTKAKPPIMGAPASRLVTFVATGADHPLETLVSFVQKPRLGRGVVSLFGMLMAVTVFALVLTSTLGRVVRVSKVDAALLRRAVEGVPDDRGIPADPASVTGTVRQLTGGAVGGATVELFFADDPEKPVASTVTADDGTFTVENLREGTYKVRFRGIGFVELWYDAVGLTFEDAVEIDVGAGEVLPDVDMTIESAPGSIAGVVLADDPTDATVTLQTRVDPAAGAVPAQLQQVAVGADGAFVLDAVPAPASYDLVVAKAGYTTVTRPVNLAAAEHQEDVEIRLQRGDGLITGRISDAAGLPLGSVAVTATNTVDELSTISLTTGDVGTFTLRNLPTPATYTISFARDGFATENRTVALADAQRFPGLDVTLAQGTGSISGVVLIGAERLGGVVVTVTNGEVTLTTETLSVGDVGSYIVSKLPVPGTYTVTFSGDGLATQIRSVDLDPAGQLNVGGLDATLTAATAVVSGTVRDASGAAASGVAVELSDGTTILTTRSADDPEGEYVLTAIPPGTYTLTFRSTGAVPLSVLVTLAAGEQRTVDAELKPQATITGTVRRSAGSGTPAPLPGAQVTAYKISEFPATATSTAITGADGTYLLADLAAPEEYVIEFAYPAGALAQASIRVTLDAGQQATGVDAVITLPGGGS